MKPIYAALCAVILSSIVHSRANAIEIKPIELANIATIRPTATSRSPDNLFPDSLLDRYGLASQNAVDTFGIGLMTVDANAVYSRARPFPEVEVVRKYPFVPMRNNPVGILAVQGYRMHYTRPDPNLGWLEEKIAKWRWPIPDDLFRSYYAETRDSARDRYHATVLYPTEWKEGDPTLICFDGVKGRVWQTSVPLAEAVRNAAAILHLSSERGIWAPNDSQIKTCIARDGSRIAVAVPRPEWSVTLLFLYDGSGSLVRCLVFKDLTGTHMFRSRSKDMFYLTFQHGEAVKRSSGGESVVVDKEGNVIGRFVDSDASSVPFGMALFSADDRYMATSRRSQDGTYSHFVFQLPGGSKVIVYP